MAKNKWLRAVMLALSILLVGYLIGILSRNTHQSNYQNFTASKSLVNCQAILQVIDTDKEADLLNLLQEIKQKNQEIDDISIVKGKKFIAHTSSEKINTRITKEIYDVGKKLSKKYKKTKDDSPLLKWKVEKTKLSLTAPIIKNGKYFGLIEINSRRVEQSKDSSNFFLYLIFFILAIIIVGVDFFRLRYSSITLPLLLVIAVFSVFSSLNNSFTEENNKFAQQTKSLVEVNRDSLTKIQPSIASDYAAKMALNDYNEDGKHFENSRMAWSIFFSLVGVLLLLFIILGYFGRIVDVIIENRLAYAYILPAMLGVCLLVFFPFIYGFVIGFTNYNLNDFSVPLLEYFTTPESYTFANFFDILSDMEFTNYRNFYFTLMHNIIWTVVNLFFHVTIGVIFALILNDARLKGRTFFKLILILPWAVPSYITALIWKGMFHKQFGAVNGFLEALGFESMTWFQQPVTAFLANLATNVWLGFPFMMIVALGALQSIPKGLYEAAEIDGATKWQSFWNVTFPLLKPAMIPSVILGTIWTFNQFNVIYLVSGGGPDGATEILITDAYRIAFEQFRQGYAAAYSIIIFMILVIWGAVTAKISKATEGVYE